MRYHRDAHNKSVPSGTPSAQQNPTGTKRKRTAAQNSPAGAKKRTLAAPKHTPSALTAQKNTLTAQENTFPVQRDPPVIAQQPLQVSRPGLDNSPIHDLSVEMRLYIIQFRLPRLRKVAIVAKSLLQTRVAPSKPSLVFATKSALSKTCHDLHTLYARELESQVLSCKVPSLALHVRNFDFAPFTSELFPKFKASHRAYFNARPGAITIHLTLTPSFFSRGAGEKGRMLWLAEQELEKDYGESGLANWLEWRAAVEKAGRKISVVYKLERNAKLEGVEDREALRMFLLLFDPLSQGQGELGDIVQEVIRVFKVIKDREDREAQDAVKDLKEDSECEESDEEEEDLEEEEEDSE